MNKYWFKQKRYGIGFYPVSKEGWMATMILISAYINGLIGNEIKNELRFLLDIMILSALFFVLFKKYTN